jgi:hypothetical protein
LKKLTGSCVPRALTSFEALTPSDTFPEMMFLAPGAVPPMVLFVAPVKMTTPCVRLPRSSTLPADPAEAID